MTIEQMHIEIKNGVQEMASTTQDRLEKEQYDLVINKMINRYVDSKIFPESDPLGKGFYADQSRVNAVRTLVKRNENLQLNYVNDSVGGTYYSELPNDYRHIVKVKYDVNYDCVDITIEKNVTNRVLAIIELPKQDSYNDLSIYRNNNKIISYERTIRYEELYMAINHFMHNTDNVYWENFGDVYAPHSFIVVGDKFITLNADIRVSVNRTVIANSVTKFAHRYTLNNTEDIESRLSTHELLSPEIYDDAQDDPYSVTTSDTPTSTISGNRITTKVDDSFILIATKLDYIRNPRFVDINLGINCDLPTNVHPDIIDMSVKYITHAIENVQKYQLTMSELFKR